MAFKLIREAQAIAALGTKAEFAKHVQRTIGLDSVASLTEAFGHSDMEVTPQHYQQWLTTIMSLAGERHVSLSKRQNFNDIAFELLDNDSFVDALGGNPETTKRTILNALWSAYKVNQAHTRVQDHVGQLADKAKEEEALSGFAQALTSAKGVEDEGYATRRAAARPVYQQALKGGKQNPYPKGSLRASLWDDAHRGSEEEEFDDIELDTSDDSDGEYSDAQSQGVDTASMSADDLASHITNTDDGSDDLDPGADDVSARVEDLEDRVRDLEADAEHAADGAVADADVGSDDIGDDQDAGVDMSSDPRSSDSDDRAPQSFPEEDDREYDEEEAVKKMFRQAITSPKEHLSAALKDVEGEGVSAWRALSMPKNPHPKSSSAYNSWLKGFKSAAKTSLGFADKPKESTSKHRPKKR